MALRKNNPNANYGISLFLQLEQNKFSPLHAHFASTDGEATVAGNHDPSLGSPTSATSFKGSNLLGTDSESSKEEKRLSKQRVDEGEVRERERVEVATQGEGRGEASEPRREDEVDETLTEEHVKDKQGNEKKDQVGFELWEEATDRCLGLAQRIQNLLATDRTTNAPPSVPSTTSSIFKTNSISNTTANSTFEALLEEWNNHRDRNDDLLRFEGPLTNVLDQHGGAIKTICAVLSSSHCASLIDLLHEILKFENGLKDRRRLDRFLQRIVKETGQLPTSMIIDNVQKSGIHPLAGGGFADVYYGTQGDIEVAIKVLRVFGDKQVLRALCSEVLVWHRLSHSNVLPFLGVCVSEFAPRYALVSPWMKNGHLLQYLRMHPESDRRAMMLGIASGLEYLHSLKPTVVHGDLRASNVLIGEDGRPMISDFGLSIIFDSQGVSVDRISYKGEGSVRWQAPELLYPEQFVGITRGPTGKSDVYAFSCVCLEIFTEKAPFSDLREPEVMFKVVFSDARPQRPPEPAGNRGLSDEVWSLMQDCWAVRPNERPNMTTVVTRIREITAISDREGS